MRKPNFMCIGAAKSGTTSLYDILRQHKDIFIPSFKEPHFFDIPSVYENGLDWYLSTYFRNVKNESWIGDFTPTYLFEENAPARILKDLGADVKFLVILRNPVDRAYSHYLHSKRDEHENQLFEKSIDSSLDKSNYLDYLRRSYIGQGLYYNMLERYFRYFPKENFLILNFEMDIVTNQSKTIKNILDFLSVDSQDLSVEKQSNKASVARLKWLKRLMKKTGWWRNIIKFMIPSLKVRQIIKNRIQRANIRTFTPESLDNQFKREIYNLYFKKDTENLEKLLGRKMNWF